MKIICNTLNGVLIDNQYKAPSGITYLFQRNVPLNIEIQSDIDYFLKSGGFEEFKPKGIKEKIIEVIKPAKKGHSETELYKMTKKEQVDLLKTLGISHPPLNERDRVLMIIKLEKV